MLSQNCRRKSSRKRVIPSVWRKKCPKYDYCSKASPNLVRLLVAGSLPRISGTLEIHCEGVIFFAWLATMMMEPRFPLSIHLHPKRGDHHLQGGIPLCPHNSSYAEVSTYNLAYINLHIYILYPHLFSYRQFFFSSDFGDFGPISWHDTYLQKFLPWTSYSPCSPAECQWGSSGSWTED